jgi:hypothetical protein
MGFYVQLTNPTQVYRSYDHQIVVRGNAVVEVPNPLPDDIKNKLAGGMLQLVEGPAKDNDLPPAHRAANAEPAVPVWRKDSLATGRPSGGDGGLTPSMQPHPGTPGVAGVGTPKASPEGATSGPNIPGPASTTDLDAEIKAKHGSAAAAGSADAGSNALTAPAPGADAVAGTAPSSEALTADAPPDATEDTDDGGKTPPSGAQGRRGRGN